ncbi:MAG: relaxase, partial [Clostridiales Family XIII bacterium]|nr:relaxase [Clostridiales Family XIII bacterium]
SPVDFDEFLRILADNGCEVSRRGKHIRFRVNSQKQVIRMDTLGGEYTEAAVRNCIAEGDTSPRPTAKGYEKSDVNMLIDIEEKLRTGKGAGYEKWAKTFNLKQAAKTLIYLQEQGLTDYVSLEEKTAAAVGRFNALSDKIKELESKMTANADLQKHIINYAKTKAVYAEYRKAGYSKKFRAEHETEILLHQASKAAFDKLAVKKLPSVSSLRAAYTPLLEEKKRIYKDYTAAKKEMRDLLTIKANADKLLDIDKVAYAQEKLSEGR